MGYLFGSILHLADEPFDFPLLAGKDILEVILQLMVAKFIAFLKLPIILTLNLNGIVRQMDHRI